MIKLAFSTLGCPAWTFDEVMAAARRWEFPGIEWRGLLGQVDIINAPEFAPARLPETAARLRDAGLASVCLGASARVVTSTESLLREADVFNHLARYAEVAAALQAPCIRLFCGDVPDEIPRSVAHKRAVALLRRLGDRAAEAGTTVALETHDAYVRSADVMELVHHADHPAVQMLWDVHHTVRLAGEKPEETLANIAGHVCHVHLKDSRTDTPVRPGSSEKTGTTDTFTYVPLGMGEVPVQAAVTGLREKGYGGYFCFEWEKRWHPNLPPPEDVFPRYVQQMRAWFPS